MNYPLISEYIDAIRLAEDNFNKLSNLRPVRDEFKFDEHIDDFSIAEIALSLKAISLNPQLYKQFGSSECFFFLIMITVTLQNRIFSIQLSVLQQIKASQAYCLYSFWHLQMETCRWCQIRQ